MAGRAPPEQESERSLLPPCPAARLVATLSGSVKPQRKGGGRLRKACACIFSLSSRPSPAQRQQQGGGQGGQGGGGGGGAEEAAWRSVAGAQGPSVQPCDPTRRAHQHLGGHVDADSDHLGRRYKCKFSGSSDPEWRPGRGACPVGAERLSGETLRSADLRWILTW